MRILIVGIGALGGTIATRALHAGLDVHLATRSAESAQALRRSGLRVSGVGGVAVARSNQIAALEEYDHTDRFDLILLATKAHEALEIAPFLSSRLTTEGCLVCIQNGGVAQILSEQLGDVVIGGLSNLGATMTDPGQYEQRNAGHILIGELRGGLSERVGMISHLLSRAIEVRVTADIRAAVWAKLLLNCSVTTIGAIAAQTMREYMTTEPGREVFRRVYDEALAVAMASGSKPERMIVDPIPPDWQGMSPSGKAYDVWIDQILSVYGDLKASMWQDFERGRRTEIDFINGYVVQLGRKLGVATSLNEALTQAAHAIEQGRLVPGTTILMSLT